MSAQTSDSRQRLTREIKMSMGGGERGVDIELADSDFNYAIDLALDRYRLRSSNSVEESFVFLTVQPNVTTYTLATEIEEVKVVYRRTFGGGGYGMNFDPFGAAMVNQMYTMQNPGSIGGGGSGWLATYDFSMQYQKLAGKMFGQDVMFTWNRFTKKIVFQRNFIGNETVALHVMNTRPEEAIINDTLSKSWIRAYAIAMSKMMLGESRSKWGSLPGPSGGITLNGESLKTEAQTELDRLETELQTQIDSMYGYGGIIG